MSLRDGTKKMSKSDPSDMSRINLTDDADTIARKIQKAKTDPEPLPSEPQGLEGRPEADNLTGIYAALAGDAAGRGAAPVRRRPVLDLQEGAGRRRRREARADHLGDEPADRRSRPRSTACSPTAAAAPARSPRRSWPRSRTSSASCTVKPCCFSVADPSWCSAKAAALRIHGAIVVASFGMAACRHDQKTPRLRAGSSPQVPRRGRRRAGGRDRAVLRRQPHRPYRRRDRAALCHRAAGLPSVARRAPGAARGGDQQGQGAVPPASAQACQRGFRAASRSRR